MNRIKLIFLLVFSVVVWHVEARAKQENDLQRVIKTCIKASDADEEFVKLTFDGKFQPSLEFKEYLFCFAREAGMVNLDNSMNNDVIEKMTAKILKDKRAAKEIRDDCDNTLYDPLNTVYYTFKCFITKIKEMSSAKKRRRRS
ncbi:unnamed protein product [Phyllotreta striolata]|uniref:Uncharacterized protein n=1 Tax=Phyllotreta striolata TaxID=444603 RepID=A0A9N9TK66_PHYSR|nr:unnamed protein product [Phyllotreta striolata]